MDDPHDLDRFLRAQAPVMARVEAELRAGRKRTHWMWVRLPAAPRAGAHPTALHYGIASLAEARAYLAHPVLGRRLRDCTALVCAVEGRSALDILGSPDDMKFRSCMTLFGAADPTEPLFPAALARFCGGGADPLTLDWLARH